MTTIDARTKLKCIERELALRRRVYAKRVERKQMSVLQVDHEIRVMEAIRDDYRDKVDTETWAKQYG
jgi:hypothetical protein